MIKKIPSLFSLIFILISCSPTRCSKEHFQLSFSDKCSSYLESKSIFIKQQMNFYDEDQATHNILTNTYVDLDSDNIFFERRKTVNAVKNVSFSNENYYEKRHIFAKDFTIYECTDIDFYYSRYIDGKQFESGKYYRKLDANNGKTPFLKTTFFDNVNACYLSAVTSLEQYFNFFNLLLQTNEFCTPFNSTKYNLTDAKKTYYQDQYIITSTIPTLDGSVEFFSEITIYNKSISFLIDVKEKEVGNNKYFYCLSSISFYKGNVPTQDISEYIEFDKIFNYL